MNHRLHRLFLIAALAAGVALPLQAQTTPSAPTSATKRPKICLVLSGGGARGAAHVGVLKVLEEYRVPVHCIAGTSMGALVGGAYATGMGLAEMEEVIAGLSVEVLFKEKPPRQEVPMRRKLDDYANFVGPELGVSSTGTVIGKGVISGVQLETVLRRLSKVQGYHRFDDLQIPYRAVATDLVTGKEVVFKHGEIANVMRASMSVPGAVAPAEFDGMILVDGMLTSNLPVAAARAMGADIVIAVNVGTPLLKREQLTNILGVAGQMLSILTEQNVQASIASLKPTDVLISPDLGDYSTGDFDHLSKIAPLGDAAARKVAERLAALSIPASEYAALRQRQQVALPADRRPIDEIRFEKMAVVNPKAAAEVMQTQPGQPVDQAVLDGDLRRLYGSGDFEHVNYRIVDDSGRRVLAVEAVEKAWGPDYLRLGLGLSSDFQGDTLFSLQAGYRKTWINSLGAEWRVDLQLGSDLFMYSDFYQPLATTSAFFIAPNLSYDKRKVHVFQGEERLATYDVSTGLVGLDVGVNFGTTGSLRLGLVGGQVTSSLETGPSYLEPPSGHLDQGALVASLAFDQLDSTRFPRSGWGGNLKVFAADQRLGADRDYTKWYADGKTAMSFGDHSFSFAAYAGGKLGSEPLPAHELFQWGGFLKLSGYETGQLLGGELQFGRMIYMHRIYRGGLLEGAYGGVSLEAGKVGRPLIAGHEQGTLQSMSLFVAADSYVGPVYLAYGQAKSGARSFYFYLGKPL